MITVIAKHCDHGRIPHKNTATMVAVLTKNTTTIIAVLTK